MAIVRRSREFWCRAVAEIVGSSLKDVARRHRVQPTTLKWWKWKLGSSESSSQKAETRLLPVEVAGVAVSPATIEAHAITIELPAGIAVRVAVGADPRYVAALVAAMRSAAC